MKPSLLALPLFPGPLSFLVSAPNVSVYVCVSGCMCVCASVFLCVRVHDSLPLCGLIGSRWHNFSNSITWFILKNFPVTYWHTHTLVHTHNMITLFTSVCGCDRSLKLLCLRFWGVWVSEYVWVVVNQHRSGCVCACVCDVKACLLSGSVLSQLLWIRKARHRSAQTFHFPSLQEDWNSLFSPKLFPLN